MDTFSLEDLKTYRLILDNDIQNLEYDLDDIICIQEECISEKLFKELQKQHDTLIEDMSGLKGERRYIKRLIKNMIEHKKNIMKCKSKHMRRRIDEYYISQSESDISRQSSSISRQSSSIRKSNSIRKNNSFQKKR